MQGTSTKATLAVAVSQALAAGVALASSEAEASTEAYGHKPHHYDHGSYNDGYDAYDTKYDDKSYGYDDKKYDSGYTPKAYTNNDVSYGKGYDDYAKQYDDHYGPKGYDDHHGHDGYYPSKHPHKHHDHYGHHHHHHHHGYHRYDKDVTYDKDAWKKAYGYTKSTMNPYYFVQEHDKKKKHEMLDLLQAETCFAPNEHGLHKCHGVSLYQLAAYQCQQIWVSGKITVQTACGGKEDPNKAKKHKHKGYSGMHDDAYYYEPHYDAKGYHNHDKGYKGYEESYPQGYVRSLSEESSEYEDPAPKYDNGYEDEYAPIPESTSTHYGGYGSAYGQIYKKYYPKTRKEMRRIQCLNKGGALLGEAVLSCYMEALVQIAFVEKYSKKASETPVRGEEVFMKAYIQWAEEVDKANKQKKDDKYYPEVFTNEFMFPYDVKGNAVKPDGYKARFGITPFGTGLNNYLNEDQDDEDPLHVHYSPICPTQQPECNPLFERYERSGYEFGSYMSHADFPRHFKPYESANQSVTETPFYQCVAKHFVKVEELEPARGQPIKLGGDPTQLPIFWMRTSQMCTDERQLPSVEWLFSLPTSQVTTQQTVLRSIAGIFADQLFEPFAFSGKGHMLGCAHLACKANNKGSCEIEKGGCFPEIDDEESEELIESSDFKNLYKCIDDGFLSKYDLDDVEAVQTYLKAEKYTSTVCAWGKDYAYFIESLYASQVSVRDGLPMGPGLVNQVPGLAIRTTTQQLCAEKEDCKTKDEMVELYKAALTALNEQCEDKKRVYNEYLEWYAEVMHGHHHHDSYGHSYGSEQTYGNEYDHGYKSKY